MAAVCRIAWGRHRRALVVVIGVLAAAVALAAPALGAFGLLRSFGETGTGPGRLSPQDPALAVDAGGRVYVADTKDERVEAFTNDGAPDGSWVVPGVGGVASAPDGTVVATGDDGVQRFAPDGTRVATLSADAGLAGVAVGPDGTVWVADPVHHLVRALGGGAVLTDGLREPLAVAVAPGGTVYVADHGTDEVVAFSAGGARLRAWPAPDPHGVALTPAGEVLVTDTRGNRVRAFDATGTALRTIGAVNGPRGVATDCRGSVYVVDTSALRVHVFGDEGDPPPCAAPPAPTPTATPAATVTPTPTATVEVAGAVAADEDPILGVRGRATAVSGTVLVARPGGSFQPLDGHALLPVGSSVDATNGHVELEFEAAPEDRPLYGRFMSGEFYDGAFKISQRTSASLVDLQLFDEGAAARRATASTSAKRKGLKVWGKAKGRFRTVGRNGAATVRGTQWLTQERADGTFFAVAEGVVAVKDFRTGRTHVLRAGDSYLARPGCVSRRVFRIRLRVPPGAAVGSAEVRVGGRRVAVRLGRRVTAPIDLRGVPAGKVTVRIRVRTTDGRVVTGKRVYATCAPKRKGGTPAL